jgi:hypothetical protein
MVHKLTDGLVNSIPQAAIVALSAIAAGWMGLHVAEAPSLPLLVAAGGGILALSTIGRNVERLFLACVAALLIGYALQARSFAYWGVPPLYIGEAVLALGIVSLPFIKARWQLSRGEYLILSFMMLGLARTLPYIREDGLAAVRDAATWYYAGFAPLVARLITRSRLHLIAGVFSKLLGGLLLWTFVMSTVFRLITDRLPHFPGSPLPILSVTTPSDRAVVLTGIAVFTVVGLYKAQSVHHRLPSELFWVLWLACVGVVAMESRGALLGLIIPLMLVFLLKPSVEWLRALTIGLMALALIIIIDPSIDLGRDRSFSVNQLAVNVQSIFSSETDNAAVQGTKDWRTEFWFDIYDDTVRGPLFWTGSGFGTNLVSQYGYDVDAEKTVRSPHSIHLTILGRMGVPGVALWLAFIVWLIANSLKSIVSCRRANDFFMSGFITWLVSMVLSGLVVASFSPFLEGPQGSIPFWCLVGAAIASIRIAGLRMNDSRVIETQQSAFTTRL